MPERLVWWFSSKTALVYNMELYFYPRSGKKHQSLQHSPSPFEPPGATPYLSTERM